LSPRKKISLTGSRGPRVCRHFEADSAQKLRDFGFELAAACNGVSYSHSIGNSQAVGYPVRASMMLLGAAARVWRILHPCFLAVETTDLRRAKI
jgi:hypothetical protein